MATTIYQQLYDAIYKKSVLESVFINLESLSEKLKGSKKITKDKLIEVFDKSVTNTLLKEIMQKEIAADNLSVFSDKELQALTAKIQDMTNKAKIIDMTIAIPLTEPDLKEIEDKLEAKMKIKIIINLKVDPTIIGGVMIKEDKY